MCMLGWIEGIQRAIEYIEDHLTEELNIHEIAEKACVSAFYFQKIFNALCGFTVGEYIRNRRLSLAAQELSKADVKVIDVAVKYGYDSPDSFTRAFTKFHGIPPSTAKLKGANLKLFAPLKIKLILEGGTMLDYKIVEKAQFTVMGRIRSFNTDTSYDEIPKFWQEHLQSEESKVVCGMYGICMDNDGKNLTT
ncbi:MAG: AraC family transcriptional regulator [Epulopiscium sp.]|nr:AraC family transcriptional regulator [Candidatus Epulonipiscium sp.]